MSEIWKKIDWIEGLKSDYEVSSIGRVRRIGGIHHTFYGDKYIRVNKILKNSLNENGYYTVTLYPFNRLTHFYIHRLVAQAFLENSLNLESVNHINEIKTDNRVENLEWCTREYNVQYSHYKLHVPAKNFRRNEYGRNIKKHKDGKFEVQCYHNGKSKYIGRYSLIEEARKARNDYLESIGLLDYLTDEEKECKA